MLTTYTGHQHVLLLHIGAVQSCDSVTNNAALYYVSSEHWRWWVYILLHWQSYNFTVIFHH